MDMRENTIIRQLEIKLKGQNSIFFGDRYGTPLRGRTRMDELTAGSYTGDNGVPCPEPINVWDMLNSDPPAAWGLGGEGPALTFCFDEWNECVEVFPPEYTIADLWNDNLGEGPGDWTGDRQNAQGITTSFKIWGKKGPDFNIPLDFPENIGAKKESRKTRKKTVKLESKYKSKPKSKKKKKSIKSHISKKRYLELIKKSKKKKLSKKESKQLNDELFKKYCRCIKTLKYSKNKKMKEGKYGICMNSIYKKRGIVPPFNASKNCGQFYN